MNFIEARQILDENIKANRRHKDYPRTTDLADKYFKLITGNNIDSLLKRFNPRESEELFKQRVALTIAITPEIINSIMKPFAKVSRTTPLAARIDVKKDTPEETKNQILEVFNDRIKNFYGSDAGIDGLDYFLRNRFLELTFTDPNAWIVIEFDAFNSVNEKARPRPFEVSAKEAINFSIKNNRPEWLLVCNDITMTGKDKKSEPGKKYTIYGDNVSVVYEQTLFKAVDVPNPGVDYVQINRQFFIVRQFETKTKKVPAFRVGYLRDLETAGRTFVAPFHSAMPTLDKSIKQVSEYDLSHCLHIFPQKIVRLAKSCPGAAGSPCFGGSLRDGSTCDTCEGTGRSLVHSSAQDVIEVEIPESVKDDGYIPLTDFVNYVSLPVELLTFQKQCVDEFTAKAHQAIFNSTALITQSGNNAPVAAEKTAFEVSNDMDSVYDTLHPYADKYSAAWMSIVEMIAILTDYEKNVSILHRFPSKFQLKTKETIYAEYKSASTSGLPSFVLDSLSNELAETIYMDDADELLKYRVKQSHFPFSGKTKDEIAFILTDSNVLQEDKILYNYFETIFHELESEAATGRADFYLLPYQAQRDAMMIKVAAIKTKIKAERPAAFAFGSNFPAEGIDEENEDQNGDNSEE
jgi:hypothetical protein